MLLITQFPPSSCHFLCVSSKYLSQRHDLMCITMARNGFHFLLLPRKPKTADYKGRGQIPVVPTVSRYGTCLRRTIFFFGRLHLARKQESCLNSPSVPMFLRRIKIASCIEPFVMTAGTSATALLPRVLY
jgi:hypothetical protein